MSNGIYSRETYLENIPEGPERTRASMTFDMLNGINNAILKIHDQPPLCAAVMDDKIKANNKTRKKITLGIGGGGGLSIAMIYELVKGFFSK